MRRVRYGIAASLDGFIASRSGSTDWIIDDPTIDFAALYEEFDIFFMGRRTYEVMKQHGWTHLDDRPKESIFVVSRHMNPEDHPEVTIVKNIDCLQALRHQDGKDIWLMGGTEVAGLCFGAGLVDAVDVAVMPVVLGDGINMIGGSGQWKLKLETLEKLDSGILMTRYSVIKSV